MQECSKIYLIIKLEAGNDELSSSKMRSFGELSNLSKINMVTTHNPNNPNIHRFIHINWNIIEHSNDCVHTFSEKAIIGFKRIPNISDLVRGDLTLSDSDDDSNDLDVIIMT